MPCFRAGGRIKKDVTEMKKTFFILFLSLFLVSLFILNQVWAGTDDNVSGYAWSDNIGWVSFNCTNQGTCGTADYGVNIDGDGIFSGYAWSDNVGWISFNPADLSGCPSGTCRTELNVGNGEISGWARILVFGSNDGWLSFRGANYGVSVNIGNGDFSGYAWSDNIGWLSFRGANYGVVTGFSFSNPPDKPGVPSEYQPTGVSWSGECAYDISIPTFHWTYYDQDGDPQAQYQIRIRNSSNFPIDGSGNPILQEDEFKCSGQVCSGYIQSTSFSLPPADWISWASHNANYYWTVRVKDSNETWSEWSDPLSFSTPLHTYPQPDFIHGPQNPVAGEEVAFLDLSVCYDSGNNAYNCQENVNNRYLWDFGDEIFCDSNTNPECRGDVTHSYAVQGNYTVTLQITDNVGTCQSNGDTPFSIKLPLPEWREVPPAN